MNISKGIMTGLMMLCAAYPASAAVDVLVSEPFSGTSLDAAWEKGLSTSGFTVSGGELVMTNSAATAGQRTMISRNTDGSANTLYNGAKVFNFYNHKLTVDVNLGAVIGDTRISYFLGVCYQSSPANRSIYDAEDGVFVALDRDGTGYRIVTYQRADSGTTSIAHIGYLSGVPTNLVMTLDGSNWTLDMSGATFTQGGFNGTSSANGTFSVAESSFNDFYFSAGMRQIFAGTTPGEMTVGGIEISAETADPPLPEGVLLSEPFSGTSLDGQWSTATLDADFTVSDGRLEMATSATSSALRAIIGRNTDSAGNTLYGGTNVFNFYDHRLIADVDINSVGGAVSGTSRISWFVGVCDAASVATYSPYDSEDGIYLALDLNSTGYRIVSYEVNGGAESISHIGYIDAVPTNLTVTLDGAYWLLEMSGASFTQGGFTGTSNANGAFSTIEEASFSGFNFTAGIRQIGAADVVGSMELDHVEITTDDAWIAPPVPTVSSTAAADGLRISWMAAAYGTYDVQSCTNLVEGSWSNRVENIPGTAGVLSVTNDFSASAEFFRVIAY
jgi:hypothetical protein